MTHLREPKLAWSYLILSPKTQGVEDTVLQGARATPSRDDSPGSRHYGALAQAINRGSEVQEEEKPQGHNMAGGRVRRDVHCQTQPYRGICARTRRGHFIQGYRSPSCTLPNGGCRHSLSGAELDGRKDADSAGKLRRAIYVRSARKCPPLTMAIWG